MKFVLTFFALAISISLFAQRTPEQLGISANDIPEGLEVGTIAPDFTGVTDDNTEVSLNQLLKEGPVALIFYRGYWCPKCSGFLTSYRDSMIYLEEMGFQLIAVTPEGADGVAKTKEKNDVNFTIISDPDGVIMRAYDVDFRVTDDYVSKIDKYFQVDIADNNDADIAELPVPATYLIVPGAGDGNGEIIWRHFDLNYSKRASVHDMIAAVKAIR